MKYYFAILVFCVCYFLSQGQSCEIDGIYHSTFEDVRLILDKNNCSTCHADQNKSSDWNYNTYDSFLKSGNCGKVMVYFGDASSSHFYNMLRGVEDCGAPTKEGVHEISSEDLGRIESWINFGAPEFCVMFYSDIKALLDENACNSCHSDGAQSWRYDSYINMMDNDLDANCENENVIIKGNSSMSLLYDKINDDDYVACGEEMNGIFGPMSKKDIATIRDWINSGANETSASLPVVLNFFTVTDLKNRVQLNWSTEVEIATEKFIIERSETGQNFKPIAEKNSKGNSTQGHNYMMEDNNPLIGDNYYRLKVVDLDGSYNYSNIRRARVKSNETIVTVYPNPAVSLERLTVKWLPRANEESTYLNIVDMNGQNLHRKIIFEGTNYVRLPYLLDGVYYVIVEDLFGGFILERVVIIN